MKRWIRYAALFLAFLMLLSFAACTGGDDGAANGGNTENTDNGQNSENNGSTDNGGNTEGGSALPEEDDADNDNRIPVTDLVP